MDTFYVFAVGQMKEPYGSTGLGGMLQRSLDFLYIKEQEKIKSSSSVWLSCTHRYICFSFAYDLCNRQIKTHSC